MATFYVSATATNGYAVGSDTNSGLYKTSPFSSLIKAIAAAAGGDTIILNDGSYTYAQCYYDGGNKTSYLNKGVVIKAENGKKTSIAYNPHNQGLDSGFGYPGILLGGGQVLEVHGLRIKTQVSGGAGTIRLLDCELYDDFTVRSGGAVIEVSDATGVARISISSAKTTFTRSSAALWGDATSGTLIINESDISMNNSSLVITNANVTIEKNKIKAGGDGNGIHANGGTGRVVVRKNRFVARAAAAGSNPIPGNGLRNGCAVCVVNKNSEFIFEDNDVRGCATGFFAINSKQIKAARNVYSGNIYGDFVLRGECDVQAVNDTFLLRSDKGDRMPGYGAIMLEGISAVGGGQIRIVNPAFLAGDISGPLVIASGSGYTIEHGGYPVDRLLPAEPFIIDGVTKDFAAWKASHDTAAIQEATSLPPYPDARLRAGSLLLRAGLAIPGTTDGDATDQWGNVWDVPPSIGAYQGAGVPLAVGPEGTLPGLFSDPSLVRHYSVLLPAAGYMVVPLGVAVPRNRAVVFAQGSNPVHSTPVSAFLLGNAETADTVAVAMLNGGKKIVHFAVAVF